MLLVASLELQAIPPLKHVKVNSSFQTDTTLFTSIVCMINIVQKGIPKFKEEAGQRKSSLIIIPKRLLVQLTYLDALSRSVQDSRRRSSQTSLTSPLLYLCPKPPTQSSRRASVL